jgi:hypothetical protein
MLPSMMARSPRRAACALLLGAALAGCGKTAGTPTSAESELNPVTPISARGAAGQVTRNTTRLGGADAVTDAAAVATAVHPGLSANARPQLAVMVSASDFPVALAASVLTGPPLGAALLYSEAKSVPAVSLQALAAMKPTGAATLGGAQILQIGDVAIPTGYVARSLPTTEAFNLAVEVQRLLERLQGSPPRHVIVVNAEGPPAFAMPAAGLAAQSGAPILLVSSSGIPAPTRTALAALGHPSIYAIGPPSALSEHVLSELEELGPVKRIAGATAAENAIAVARFGEGSFGWNIHEAGHGLVFATSARPLDGPGAAALSASGDYAPLLLLESATQIPVPLQHYLEDIQPAYSPQVSPVSAFYNHGWIIGNQQAISAGVQAQLDSLLEVAQRTSAPTRSLAP